MRSERIDQMNDLPPFILKSYRGAPPLSKTKYSTFKKPVAPLIVEPSNITGTRRLMPGQKPAGGPY